MNDFNLLDLFCGAGGTSTGAAEAIEACGYRPRLTAVNHWDRAIQTHSLNHPDARHLCTGIDAIKPRELFQRGELDLLWASPECTHHSIARGGMPINDQSRATAWCVLKFMDALLPPVVLIENVKEFKDWGPIGSNGRPLKSRKGEIFEQFLNSMRSLGYKVGYRLLCAADAGDPTDRVRLFIQAVRGRREVVWPNPVRGVNGVRYRNAEEDVIDWEIPCPSIYERKKALRPNTMKRIFAGLESFGLKDFLVELRGTDESQVRNSARELDRPVPTVTAGGGHLGMVKPFLVCMEHGQTVRSADRPMPTITTARGGAIGVVKPFIMSAGGPECGARSVEKPVGTVLTRDHRALVVPSLLPQQSGGVLRPVSDPVPTVSTSGAIGLVKPFLVQYYGTGSAHSVGEPVPTVTTRDRFGLVRPVVEVDGERFVLDIGFRMLQPHELAAAQGFKRGYQFSGNKKEQLKQIGNAVPRRLARAIACAAITQKSDVSWLRDE